MNVEVEVVRENRTTYLVMGVKSLEEAERVAVEHTEKRLACSTQVPKRWTRRPRYTAVWSQPVIVRDGEIVREENS